MKSKNYTIMFRVIATTIAVVALAFAGRTVIRAAFYVPDTGVVDVTTLDVPSGSGEGAAALVDGSVTAPKVVKKAPPANYPAKVIIPSLGIRAAVQTVGITKNGSIGTPSNFTDVAWYVRGGIPGKAGTAIFDGHVDNGLGLAGVFKHLDSMKVGNAVDVVTNDGKTLHFTVSNVTYYDYKQVPNEAMFATSSESQLVLITCEGNWVGVDQTYDKRLIVTAVLN